MNDDVFLKHFIVGERRVARLEDMNASNVYGVEQQLPEGTEVRSIAEAARSDGDDFSVRSQELDGNPQKACVQVACLDPRFSEEFSLARAGLDLAIGRIENGAIEVLSCSKTEQVAGEHVSSSGNEVFLNNSSFELDPDFLAFDAASLERVFEVFDQDRIQLIGR